MARGRKVTVGDSSIILYARHSAKCAQRGDNSGTVDCNCIRWVQFRDGTRESTKEWSWAKAEVVAKKRIGGAGAPAAEKSTAYKVEKAINGWLAEREQDGLRSLKAAFIGRKLLHWCNENDITFLSQIQKQALREWRTEGWKYQTGNSTSLKVHWSILRGFFSWCVEGDLLESNPCPKFKGKIEATRVVPLNPGEIDALLSAAERVNKPGWTEERRLKMRALILLQQWSGMAIVDAVKLSRSELLGEVISSRRHKTNKSFSVPIPLWLADLLRAVPNNDTRYFFWHRKASGKLVGAPQNIVGGWYAKVFAEAGIDGHSHQLRHSFASYHLGRGIKVERVAEWMGDTVTEVTKTYAHWIAERTEISLKAMQESWRAMGLDDQGNPIVKTNAAVQ